MQITSLQNPQIKRLIKLRDRRARDAEGLTLIEGGDEVALALAAGVALTAAWLCPDLPRFAKFNHLRAELGQTLVEALDPLVDCEQ